MPHLTLSFGRGSDAQSTSGDLTELSLGLACFLAWFIAAPLSMPAVMRTSGLMHTAGADVALSLHASFLVSLVAGLVFVGSTNQRFLRFYVGRRILVLASALCIAGTAMSVFGTTGGSFGIFFFVLGGIMSGAGTAIFIPLWGTAFARYEFPTIALNCALGVTVGVIAATALIDWITAAISIPIQCLLLCVGALLLWRLTPIPYYRRYEVPMFHALPVNHAQFIIRLGLPTLIFGIALGVVGSMFILGVVCTNEVACGLMIGASCAVCIVLFMANVALMKNEAHWDTLFRYMLPVAGLGMIGVPLFCGAYQLASVFLITAAFVILTTLLLTMFADIAQEFRLSPIFMFGIGSAILFVGVILGTLLVPPTNEWQTMSSVRWTGLAMGAIVLLMLAGSINPRKRDVVRMLASDKEPIAVDQLNEILVNRNSGAAGAPTSLAELAAGIAERARLVNNDELNPSAVPAGSVETATSATDADIPSHAPDSDRVVYAVETLSANESEDIEAEVATDKDASQEPGLPDAGDNKPEPKPEKGAFYRKCEEISDRYLLSRRESEVLFLLAKGHKAGFIEDKLCISKSTAKTHINHIYKKLDIHTQQELLNMVEERQRVNPDAENAPRIARHHGF